MKAIHLILSILIASATAAPQTNYQQQYYQQQNYQQQNNQQQYDSKAATILKYENDNVGVQGYNFAYETSDGTVRQEQAELKNVGTENEALVVRGSISWIAPDGKTYTLNYIADENGYRPTGDHLPKV